MTDDHLRDRVERGVRWLVEQYRSEGAQALLNRVRSAAAQLLSPPAAATAPRAATQQRPATRQQLAAPRGDRQDWPEDVLADMCADVALRDLNLVDSLLAQLESLEANEGDPDALARLYQLDHLATRLRRNAENLRVLAGQDAGSAADKTSSLVDVLRAAMSSIEQYTRIEIGWVATLGVVDLAADDVGRLLAELLDNATAHSPPTSTVTVSAHVTEQSSVLLRVEDTGIGLPPDRLAALNDRLLTAPVLDSESIEHMGLAVVRRLAAKHGIRVTLSRRTPHGTTASVLLPSEVVCEAPSTSRFGPDTPSTGLAPSGPEPARHMSPVPTRRSPDSTAAGEQPTTRNGLPRRVPHSLRESSTATQLTPSSSSGSSPTGSSPTDGDTDSRAGREQLIADLGAFAAGEQAAQEGLPVQPRPESPDQGSHNDH